MADEPGLADAFVQEVRRTSPFFPAAVARASKPIPWNGSIIPARRAMMLDLYGTSRDPRLWQDPDRFWPERFQDWVLDPFSLVPQGGGDANLTHRCPGEVIVIALMKLALDQLTRHMRYDIPAQDLAFGMDRLPAIPRSGFVMRNVAAFVPPPVS